MAAIAEGGTMVGSYDARKNLGKILQRQADRFCLSTVKLSKLTGISQSTVSRVLGGMHKPDLVVILALLAVMGVDLKWLQDAGVHPPCKVKKCSSCGTIRSHDKTYCQACHAVASRPEVWFGVGVL